MRYYLLSVINLVDIFYDNLVAMYYIDMFLTEFPKICSPVFFQSVSPTYNVVTFIFEATRNQKLTVYSYIVIEMLPSFHSNNFPFNLLCAPCQVCRCHKSC